MNVHLELYGFSLWRFPSARCILPGRDGGNRVNIDGLCLLDTELTQVLPGHVVIHDNLTNHVALPTMRHLSF